MELNTILLIAAVLICPLSMGIMMWLMNRNMGGQQDHSVPSHTSHAPDADHLKALREQRQQLEQEIAETEKIVALEAKKTLIQGDAPDGVAKQ